MSLTVHHEVPTHLDVEDRVLFGLTARQFLYVLVGSSATYALWDRTAACTDMLRVGLVAMCIAVTLAFALLRPAGRALEEWLAAGLVYAASARRSTWQPRRPMAEEWRPAGAGWQELTPSLSWAEHDEP